MPNQSSITKTLTIRMQNSTYNALGRMANRLGITRNEYAKGLLEKAEDQEAKYESRNSDKGTL